MISPTLSPSAEAANNSLTTLGIRLKELRLSRGLSQADLAAQFHLSPSAINRYELGLREPNLYILGSFARFFGVDFNYLLCQPDESPLWGNSNLISKFNALDDRGKSAVLNTLEHEYSSIFKK